MNGETMRSPFFVTELILRGRPGRTQPAGIHVARCVTVFGLVPEDSLQVFIKCLRTFVGDTIIVPLPVVELVKRLTRVVGFTRLSSCGIACD